MSKALKNKILGAVDIKEEVIRVEAWENSDVLITGFNGTACVLLAQALGDGKADDKEDAGMAMIEHAPEILVQCLRDPETRELLFDAGDVPALKQKSIGALLLCVNKAIALSDFGGEDVVEQKKS